MSRDLRRTIATGLHRPGVLNRLSGTRGGIAGVYQRHDWALEKRAALDAWAAHVKTIVEKRLPLKRSKACERAILPVTNHNTLSSLRTDRSR
jgi:hypothetical protein